MGRVIGLVFDEEPKYVCPICGKAYKTAEGLEKHTAKEHSEENRNAEE